MTRLRIAMFTFLGMKLFAGTGKQMVDLVGVFVSTFALTLLILCDLI